MREFDFNSKNSNDECTTILKQNDFNKHYGENSPSLEVIIKNSRMTIMTDNVKNKPRKIILDTKYESCRSPQPRNKEAQRLSEIVFGNFSLSSRVNGYKLHIVKNPAEVIVSKLFNVPFNSIFYDNKTLYRKVSPDSGNVQSLSPCSSNNSMCSSNQSSSGSVILHPQSPNSYESGTSNLSFSRSISRNRVLIEGQQLSITQSPRKEGMKNGSSSFFHDNFDVYNCRSNIMMSAVFIFSLPEENKAEFEEFIFQYYFIIESILNRIACLILEDSYNIYNGKVIECWKQSKKWIISFLPRRSRSLSDTYNSKYKNQSPEKDDKHLVDMPMFEEVVNYFVTEKKLSFLSQVISAVLISNPIAASKFIKHQSYLKEPSFPYSKILQSLGVDFQNQSFNRIIVKGLANGKRPHPPSSWKDKLSSSLNYYKKMWNNEISSSEINVSSQGPTHKSEILTHAVNKNTTNEYKEVQMITALVADLIRPVTKVVYQSQILPADVPKVDDCVTRKLRTEPNTLALEIPLLDDGLLLDHEVLPDNNVFYFPNIIADRILGSITPLQGYVYDTSPKNFSSQMLLESKRSEVICTEKAYKPSFLVIDVDSSSVMSQSESLMQSCWIQKLLSDFSILTKVEGYDNVIGHLFLEAAFADLSQKRMCIKEFFPNARLDCICSSLLEAYGFLESDLSLLLPERKD